ncbi:MAG: hypothetical protein KGS72_00620 [Cyanobacteria bacterium REEB67]|nr:hypothetical protein [Cyanobacteria bacterium REEB67]
MESSHSIETAQAVSSPVEDTSAQIDSCQIFDATPADINPFLSGAHDLVDPQGVNADLLNSAASDCGATSDFAAETSAEASAQSEAIEASPVESGIGDSTASVSAVHGSMVGADDRVSKRDLVSLLEGFVRIIKTDDVAPSSSPVTTGTRIDLASGGLVVNEARIDDRTVEIDQLRGLVIEAQDTIIKLLTDRVEDRSRIATLEAQLSLLPDLQAQADRAMSVAVRTEEYRGELNKMKFELDRFRLFRVRVEAENKKGSVFNRIQKWLFSRPNAADDTLKPSQRL